MVLARPRTQEARRCRRAFRAAKVLVELLDPQAGDGPGDHELLDLLGALEDIEALIARSVWYRKMPLTCTYSGRPSYRMHPIPARFVQL